MAYQQGQGVMCLYFWEHSNVRWGHASLKLSDGTHISWWPSTAVGANKGHVGLVPVAVFTEWIAPNADQTLEKDIQYEESQPAIMQIPVGLNERNIKAWWLKFKASQKYNAARLNCSTVVYLALKHGGALNYVADPGNWWWDPDRTLQFARVMKEAMMTKKKGAVQFIAPPEARAQQLQRARLQADANAQMHGINPAYD